MSINVHSVATEGFGAGTNDLYNRARPSYPSDALAYMRSLFKAKESLNIAEIGAGTGIFTRALIAHPEWSNSIANLKAIEPSEGMRENFAENTADIRVSISHGTFDTTNVENEWADLIIIAQAFHWCPDYNAACAEFARVLKPDGIVMFIWNLEDRDGAPWVAQLRDIYEAHEKGTPQFRLQLWRQAFDTPAYKSSFSSPEEKEWAYTLPGSLEIVTNRAFSKSYIAILPPDEKERVKTELISVIEKGEGKVWKDESKGEFEYPYKTHLVVSRRKL